MSRHGRADPSARPSSVAIVGGGAAGTFLALALARQGVRSVLFDARGAFATGLAFAAPSPWHRLNVPLEKIGKAGPSERQGFGDWYAAEVGPPGPDFSARFVPRQAYGRWLRRQLDDAVGTGLVRCVQAEIVTAALGADGVRIEDRSGVPYRAAALVLSLGNHAPRTFRALHGGPVVPDVWQPGALDRVVGPDPVLILGTGATAVDAFLELASRGHTGPVTMVSRRGLLPLVDAVPEPYRPARDFAAPRTLREVLRDLRRETAEGVARGAPWQAVLDAFREDLETVWRSLSARDRAAFGRHLRAHWLVHRHRLAPDIAARLAKAQSPGRSRSSGGGSRVPGRRATGRSSGSRPGAATQSTCRSARS